MKRIITFPKEITFRKMKGSYILCNMHVPLLRGSLFVKNVEVKLDDTNSELLQKFKQLKGVRKIKVLVQGPFLVDRYLVNAKIIDLISEELPTGNALF